MSNTVTVLSILTIGFLGVMALLGKITGVSTIISLLVGLTLVVIAILFACFLCFYRLRNKLVSIFLDWSTRFFKEKCAYFILTFIFVLLTAGLIILCLFQHLSYVSHNTPIHQPGDVYLQLVPNYVLFVLNLIEFIWGLQFLKDSCKSLPT